jgi:hypothetical protein
MSLSATTHTALQRTADPFGLVELLTIDGDGLEAPVRLVNDTANFVSGGETYLGLPFSLTFPEAATSEVPRAQLRIDNVGLEITADLEALPPGSELMATVATAYRKTPDTIEYSFTAPLFGVRADVMSISASVGPGDLMRRPAVAIRYDPITAPGLFPD